MQDKYKPMTPEQEKAFEKGCSEPCGYTCANNWELFRPKPFEEAKKLVINTMTAAQVNDFKALNEVVTAFGKNSASFDALVKAFESFKRSVFDGSSKHCENSSSCGSSSSDGAFHTPSNTK
jgi:hypothetical protein